MTPDHETSPHRRPRARGAPCANPSEAPSPAEKVRDDFRWVYGELGGREALLAWSRENEKEFFRMFFQLLPREATRDPEGEALVEALFELAEAEPPAGAPEGNR